jgi:hypothetical protein
MTAKMHFELDLLGDINEIFKRRHQLWWVAAPVVLVPAAGRGIIAFDAGAFDRRQLGTSDFKSEAS